MRKHPRILLVCQTIVAMSAAHAQGLLKTYPSTATHFTSSIVPAQDGGYVLAGAHWDPGDAGTLALTKVDPLGDVQWSKRYGPVSKLDRPEVVGLLAGGFLLLGASNQARDLLLIRVNDLGDTLWTGLYDHPDQCIAKDAIELANGDFILASNTFTAFYLTRINSQGDIVWTHGYGGGSVNAATATAPRLDLLLNPDSTVVLAGTAAYSDATQTEHVVLKADLNGTLIWGGFFGDSDEDGLRAIEPTDDGGYLVMGYHRVNERDLFAAKLDGAGSMLWSRIYPTPDTLICRFLLRSDDGHYVIGGSYGSATAHGLLVKINDQGDVLWSNGYALDHGFRDGLRAGTGAVFAGTDNADAQIDASFFMQDTLGASICSIVPYPLTAVDVVLPTTNAVNTIAGLVPIQEPVTVTTLLLAEFTECGTAAVSDGTQDDEPIVRPNPANGEFFIRGDHRQWSTVQLMDASGRIVRTWAPQGRMDVGGLAGGVYTVRVMYVNGSVRAQRVVVE